MRSLLFLFVVTLGFSACKKNDPDPPTSPSPPTAGAALTFTNLTFSSSNAFFSTTNGMTQPVNATTAEPMADEIDITFIYDGDYGEAGFLAPLTRSQEWYWNQYHRPWLAVADSTELFGTNLSATQYNSAKNNSSLIGTYFADGNLMFSAPHGIFPTGTCVGGRNTSTPANVPLNEGDVFGFKNHVTGKRGLIYIRTDQDQLWPDFSSSTKVDIIREP